MGSIEVAGASRVRGREEGKRERELAVEQPDVEAICKS